MFDFVPKTSLLPVKKKTFYMILHNVMYHFINCPVFRHQTKFSKCSKVSKVWIEKVNTIIGGKSLVNQWRNTNTVINWFENNYNRSNCIFLQFHIKEFYSSILKGPFMKAINLRYYQQRRSKHHNTFS